MTIRVGNKEFKMTFGKIDPKKVKKDGKTKDSFPVRVAKKYIEYIIKRWNKEIKENQLEIKDIKKDIKAEERLAKKEPKPDLIDPNNYVSGLNLKDDKAIKKAESAVDKFNASIVKAHEAQYGISIDKYKELANNDIEKLNKRNVYLLQKINTYQKYKTNNFKTIKDVFFMLPKMLLGKLGGFIHNVGERLQNAMGVDVTAKTVNSSQGNFGKEMTEEEMKEAYGGTIKEALGQGTKQTGTKPQTPTQQPQVKKEPVSTGTPVTTGTGDINKLVGDLQNVIVEYKNNGMREADNQITEYKNNGILEADSKITSYYDEGKKKKDGDLEDYANKKKVAIDEELAKYAVIQKAEIEKQLAQIRAALDNLTPFQAPTTQNTGGKQNV